ncbi:MAG: hypothetical protein AB2A00_11520 [Myxococcota bacterium]
MDSVHGVWLLMAAGIVVSLVLLAIVRSEYRARREQHLVAPDVWHTYASDHVPLHVDEQPSSEAHLDRRDYRSMPVEPPPSSTSSPP